MKNPSYSKPYSQGRVQTPKTVSEQIASLDRFLFMALEGKHMTGEQAIEYRESAVAKIMAGTSK
jgi:hypothetical protein